MHKPTLPKLSKNQRQNKNPSKGIQDITITASLPSLWMWVEIRPLVATFLSLIDLWAFMPSSPFQFSKVTKLASIHLNLFAP